MKVDKFVARWKQTEGSERANKDSYLKELCQVLQVPEPDGKTGDRARDNYVFEADAVLLDEHGQPSVGTMDLYRAGCFVLEAKQGSETGKKIGLARRARAGWDAGMREAAHQAARYARTLEDPPPFIIVADIGWCFDLYCCFDGSCAYRPYPTPHNNRLALRDLAKHVDLLRTVWLDPLSLDPRKASERVTTDVAQLLSKLATSLERDHPPEVVSRFLLRSIFTMFAEDIGLLRENVFKRALKTTWLPQPDLFKDGVEELWEAMNAGKRFFLLGKLLKFNGGLFADPVALALDRDQLEILLRAAEKNWADVEPAIFGALIERALSPSERHRLGAHFTPKTYVERLLRPTVEEPLRAEWELVQIRIRELVPPDSDASKANVIKAQEEVRRFHARLCETTVLDPACGTANFLYVALSFFKQLEGEVIAELYALGATQLELTEELLVTPRQFLGIEVRKQSRDIAELVLWIGYLQWHHKMYGGAKNPPEPVLRDHKNIRCGDAVLAWDGEPYRTSKRRWDGETFKPHPVTGLPIPDEAAEVAEFRYIRPRKADEWSKADFIVGNPPYVGNKLMRLTLGDGYVDALRAAWPDVPESADYVAYWLSRAGKACLSGEARRVGLICTSSITQILSRRVLEDLLAKGLSVAFAVPEHPWVDDKGSAAVTVAMVVLEKGSSSGVVATAEGGPETLRFSLRSGQISAALAIGPDVSKATPLAANSRLSRRGVIPLGEGFIVDEATLPRLGKDKKCARPFVNASTLLDQSPPRWAIDVDHMEEEELRDKLPRAYQWLHERVLPFRRQQRNPERKRMWWKFARRNGDLREAIAGLARYIVVPYNPKHIQAYFVPGNALPDDGFVAIGLDDAYFLGVLCSRFHVRWALKAGTRLGKGNTPRYNNTACFEKFPFPPEPSPRLRSRITKLAEKIDGHRAERMAAHSDLSMTGMLNVLEKRRRGEKLSAKEQVVNELGLVATLEKLHDDLDQAVAEAYGWPVDLTDEEVLAHLVDLNAVRADEERQGTPQWLRPAFQIGDGKRKKVDKAREPDEQLLLPWPADLPHQVAIVRTIIFGTDVALTAQEVAAACEGAPPASVEQALETLQALGMAASFQSEERRWKGLARTTGERLGARQESPPSSRPAVRSTG